VPVCEKDLELLNLNCQHGGKAKQSKAKQATKRRIPLPKRKEGRNAHQQAPLRIGGFAIFGQQ